MKTNKVLLPIEGPDVSLQMLPHIEHLLDPAQTELVLLHVAPEPELLELEPGNPEMTIYVDQREAGMKADFADAMLPHVRQLEQLGFRVTTTMRFGPPAAEIEHYIDHEGVDLVAMATHGRTGLARLARGSVAEHVLHHVKTPILLYRAVANGAAEPATVSAPTS